MNSMLLITSVSAGRYAVLLDVDRKHYTIAAMEMEALGHSPHRNDKRTCFNENTTEDILHKSEINGKQATKINAWDARFH